MLGHNSISGRAIGGTSFTAFELGSSSVSSSATTTTLASIKKYLRQQYQVQQQRIKLAKE